MENEIKVGEYVRTDKGNIGRIIEIRIGTNLDKKEFQNIYELDTGLWTVKQYIVKHSKNIIDLIQVGDYVNGRKIEKIVDISHKHNSIIVVYDGELWNEEIRREDIETIVTKQQFESTSYKVK